MTPINESELQDAPKSASIDESQLQDAPKSQSIDESQLQDANPSLMQHAKNVFGGPTEAMLHTVTGMAAPLAAGGAGLASIAMGEPIEYTQQQMQGAQRAFTYQPTTPVGKIASSVIDKGFQGVSWLTDKIGHYSPTTVLTKVGLKAVGAPNLAEAIGGGLEQATSLAAQWMLASIAGGSLAGRAGKAPTMPVEGIKPLEAGKPTAPAVRMLQLPAPVRMLLLPAPETIYGEGFTAVESNQVPGAETGQVLHDVPWKQNLDTAAKMVANDIFAIPSDFITRANDLSQIILDKPLHETLPEEHAMLVEEMAKGPGGLSDNVTTSPAVGESPIMPMGGGSPPILNKPNVRDPGAGIFNPDIAADRSPAETVLGRIMYWAQRLREKFPMEEAVRSKIPNSPVISVASRSQMAKTNAIWAVFRSPVYQAYAALDQTVIDHAEDLAVRSFTAQGGDAAALASSRGELPKAMTDYMDQIEAGFESRNEASRLLRGKELPRVQGPYVPRDTDLEYEEALKVSRNFQSVSGDLSQSMKQYEQKRRWSSRLEGQANGETYIPSGVSALMHAWNDIKLRTTADDWRTLMSEDVIHDKLSSAQEAATRLGPTFKPTFVKDLFPGHDMWVRSREEAVFLKQQFSSPGKGLGMFVSYVNQIFRDPNFMLPFVHMKNITATYAQSGGSMLRLVPDMIEYYKKSNPIKLGLFKNGIGVNDSLESGAQLMMDHVRKSQGDMGYWLRKAIGTPAKLMTAPGRTLLWKYFDPAVKYARFSQYLDAGMKPYEAVNNTVVDMVNYGTRSEVTDALRNIPGVMYVPWRVGSMISVVKQLKTQPLRAAVTIGMLDYMRQETYNKTGKWFSLPIDYIQGPIAREIGIGNNKTQLALQATRAILELGIGGGALPTVKNVTTGLYDAFHGSPIKAQSVMQTWWGLTQIKNLGEDAHSWYKNMNADTFFSLMATTLTGANPRFTQQPESLLAHLPAWVPQVEKSGLVKYAEYQQAQRAIAQKQTTMNQQYNPTKKPLWKQLLSSEQERQRKILQKMTH